MGFISKGNCNGSKAPKVKLCICLISGTTFLMIAALSILLDPITILAKYFGRLDYGTLMHEALMKEADSVHLSLYLFNITNAEQFANGEDEKLKIKEVGPFTYQLLGLRRSDFVPCKTLVLGCIQLDDDPNMIEEKDLANDEERRFMENRTNEGLEIDLERGVVRYTPRFKVTFLPEESIGDPKDIIVTVPNIAMLAMASEATNFGYFAKMGFNLLATRYGSKGTVTINAYDYMWGFDEPLIRLGNQIMPGWISFEKLGLLDRLYDKKTNTRLEVSSRNSDKFMIKTANGLAGLKQWGYNDPKTRSSCNSFTDVYEGLCYPPEVTPARRIRIYRNILCRFLDLDYHGTVMTDLGVEGLMYKISNRTYRNIPENQCLCSKGICYDGVSDLSPCMYGLPVVLSNAHFMDTDPKIYDRIEGFAPSEEQHGSEFIVEKTLGMVMTTKFSVQLNILVRDVGFNSKISRYSNMFVPVGYFKIVQPKVTDENVSTIRLMHVYAPYLLLTLQILLSAGGLLLLLYSVKCFYYSCIYSRRKEVSLHLQTKEAIGTVNEPLLR